MQSGLGKKGLAAVISFEKHFDMAGESQNQGGSTMLEWWLIFNGQ